MFCTELCTRVHTTDKQMFMIITIWKLICIKAHTFGTSSVPGRLNLLKTVQLNRVGVYLDHVKFG